MKFTLKDPITGQSIDGEVILKAGTLALKLDGYGDHSSIGGDGEPVYLELYDGELKLRVWSDINSEDATHVIGMESAKESNRQ